MFYPGHLSLMHCKISAIIQMLKIKIATLFKHVRFANIQSQWTMELRCADANTTHTNTIDLSQVVPFKQTFTQTNTCKLSKVSVN